MVGHAAADADEDCDDRVDALVEEAHCRGAVWVGRLDTGWRVRAALYQRFQFD